MTLFTRIHELFLANAYHAIDLAEDPEKMLKQVLQEMDENIRQARTAVVSAVTSEKQLAAQLERHRTGSGNLVRKAESAIAAGQDELAKAVLARKVEHDRVAAELQRSWHAAKNTCENLKAQLHELVARRTEAGRQREALVARQRAARARKTLCHSLGALSAWDSTDDKLKRMQVRVSELEAESLAVCEVLGEPARPEAEAGDLETALQVDAEFAAIKERLRTPSTGSD